MLMLFDWPINCNHFCVEVSSTGHLISQQYWHMRFIKVPDVIHFYLLVCCCFLKQGFKKEILHWISVMFSDLIIKMVDISIYAVGRLPIDRWLGLGRLLA